MATNNTKRTENGDRRVSQPNSLGAANYWTNPATVAGVQASDQKIASDLGISLNQLSPQVISAYAQQEAARGGGFMEQTFMNKILPMLVVGTLTAGVGSAAGGALAGTAGTATTAATSGALGAGMGTGGALTTAGTALAGAGAGSFGGGLSAALSGGNIGKGLLLGGLTGAAGGALSRLASPATSSMTNAGVNSQVASGITKTATGAATGALGGAISGRGALAGAQGGAIGGGSNAVAGSILSGLGSVFNSGNTVNPQLTQSYNPSTPNVSVDPNYFDPSGLQPIPMDTGYGQYSPYTDPNTGAYNNYGNNPGTDTSLANLLGGLDPNYQVSNQYYNQGNAGNGGGGGGNGLGASSAGGSAISSLLSKLLGGGSGGSGVSSSLLSQLLGLGVNGAAGAVNSQANQYASQQYAGQTAYNPYAVNGPQGSTSFNGTTANTNLNPATQQTYNALGGLANSSAQSLQGGQQVAANQYYNQLQAQDQNSNNHFYQSNLDSQMANGVLSSTAGQYQSQAALDAINQKSANNQVMANNFGNQQQQNQLGQLTAGLNGQSQINSQQLQQLQTGAGMGSQAGNINLQAYKPLAGANANSNLGNILSSIGSQSSNGGSSSSLLRLLGLGG